MHIAFLRCMKELRVLITLVLLNFLFVAGSVDAFAEDDNTTSIKLRAGYHKDYLRIVFEGPETAISEGTVSWREGDIVIDFGDAEFEIKKRRLPIEYERSENSVILTPSKRGRLRIFSMRNPSRLVIDVRHGVPVKEATEETEEVTKAEIDVESDTYSYGDDEDTETDMKAESYAKLELKKRLERKREATERVRAKRRMRAMEHIRVEGDGAVELSNEEIEIQENISSETDSEERDAEVEKTVKSEVSAGTEQTASEGKTGEEKKGEEKKELLKLTIPKSKDKKDRVTANIRGKYNFDDSFITGEYEEIWEVLKSGKSFGAIKMLSLHKPDSSDSIAIYHFLYGMAYSNLGEKLIAIDEFRLAYIYAADKNLKEISLFKRAGLYKKSGLLYEARGDYSIFIRDYESSQFIKKAHLNLGKVLTELGSYNEAVEHYEMAGEVAEALFSRANALQRLGKVAEAREVYAKAIEADKRYIKNSPETYFLVGENMRMAGELEEAKEHLIEITDGPYKDRAAMSLGLIAMEQSDAFNAIKKFESLNESKDRKIRVKALFNLHEAYMKAGRSDDAISTLKKIRTVYPDSSLYKTTLLKLSGLYRKEGKLRDSVPLLKELVYGKEPPLEVFNELESLLLEASKKSKKSADEYELVELWKEVGQWMLDESREDFLLEMTENLKHEGKPFLDLAIWLMENASGNTRTRTAIYLADFFAGMGNPYVAGQYLGVAKYSSKLTDDILRVEAKIKYSEADPGLAFEKMKSMKRFKKNDLKLLGRIILELKMSKGEARKLYEKRLNEQKWEAEDYIRLADMLLEDNKMNKALKYYKLAFKKKPDDEWTVYRIGHSADTQESKEMFGRLEKGDTLLSRLAKTKLLELDLLNKVKEVY